MPMPSRSRLDVHDLGVQRLPSGVEELHHLLQAALRVERLLLLLSLALVVSVIVTPLLRNDSSRRRVRQRRVVVLRAR